MAPKKNQQSGKSQSQPTVSQAIRQASSGGITKSELQQISKQTGATAQQVVQKMDTINRNIKQAGGEPTIALNSGAANLLIKQAQNQSPIDAYMSRITGEPQYGTGPIGKTIQSMIGSPGFAGTPIKGQLTGAQPAVPSQMMIGGTMIRPGGRVAVRPMGAAPAIGETVAPTDVTTGGTTGGETTGGDMTGGDQFDYQSILDALAGMQQPEFDMSALTDMFNTQFEQLQSQFQTNKPLQFAQLGRAYGGDAIRARQRMRKTTRDYRRSLPSAALGQAIANLAIGGGLTL